MLPVATMESRNGHPSARRTTAESMATRQKDISVSEFFAKNRHLLGFDNPRKALLTTVKEAVDNALDACEEAGILPEVWVQIDQTDETRFRVSIQDNGPGIVKAQIPNIFGKLLYGSKFHRLRMSRGQQGIGISAAGMYGLLTTGKPICITSKTGPRKSAWHYEIQIDTKRNRPEILNNKGAGLEITPGPKGDALLESHEIGWHKVDHGTRVSIELEGRYQAGRASVEEYLQQTAIANPHVTLHFTDPKGATRSIPRATEILPPEPVEIKPHPYGVELGMLINMTQQASGGSVSAFLTDSFSSVSSSVAREVCQKAGLSTRANVKRIGRQQAETLYRALQETKIQAPRTDCVCPIGQDLLLAGLHNIVQGEFYTAVTREPAVYRGNPFVIEAALAYGGTTASNRIDRTRLVELLSESDTRTVRQFLTTTFSGLGPEAAKKILKESHLGSRAVPAKLKPAEIERLFEALEKTNSDEGQSASLYRFANRVPLLFQPGACAVTQAVSNLNWRSYGLTQSRGSLPNGPITIMVHIASVWVPFTSESKEAVANYPEIQKELRLALQAVGRKLGAYLNRRQRVNQEGERRRIFLRYLREVADSVSAINGADSQELYEQLLEVAKRKTAEADLSFDESGQVVRPGEDEQLADGVLIIDQNHDVRTPIEALEADEAEVS